MKNLQSTQWILVCREVLSPCSETEPPFTLSAATPERVTVSRRNSNCSRAVGFTVLQPEPSALYFEGPKIGLQAKSAIDLRHRIWYLHHATFTSSTGKYREHSPASRFGHYVGCRRALQKRSAEFSLLSTEFRRERRSSENQANQSIFQALQFFKKAWGDVETDTMMRCSKQASPRSRRIDLKMVRMMMSLTFLHLLKLSAAFSQIPCRLTIPPILLTIDSWLETQRIRKPQTLTSTTKATDPSWQRRHRALTE